MVIYIDFLTNISIFWFLNFFLDDVFFSVSNPVYAYYAFSEGKAMCRICLRSLTFKRNGYLSSLTTHLRNLHPDDYQTFKQEKQKIRDEKMSRFSLLEFFK